MGPHWIKQWINNLAVLNEQFRDDEGRVDFEALGREEYLFRMALITKDFTKSERARDTFMSTKASYDKWVENGRQGGRPPKAKEEEQTRAGDNSLSGGLHSSPARTSGPMPEDRQAVIDYAEAEGLDVEDAIECWYATMERDGKTADGKEITNWKAYIRKWCATRKNNRRSA